ncbi:MAG: hypothetical protein K2Y05_02515 [Hyphomicrobiaceae bacterium]|nr:hypothetical protein [Hyphomicrobiaceae bacterium]
MTTPTQTAKNFPTHKLYRIVKGRTNLDKDIWTPVAVCWPHKDGSGFSVKFEANEAPAPGGEYVMRRNRSPSQAV